MKKFLILTAIVCLIVMAMPVYATDGSGVLKLMAKGDRPSNFGPAADPPDGAKVTILSHGNLRTVVVSGFPDIYKNRVEIYGKADGIEECPLVNGQCTYRAGRWLNFPWMGSDNNFHYNHVVDQYQIARQPWQGPGTCIMPDFGKGAAIIACDDLADGYRPAK